MELADQPGALAGVTTALAALQVDVATVDVLEVDGHSVIDELLLRLPPAVDVQEVRDVLRVAGADVLSSAATTAGGDPVVAAFDLARAVLSEPGDADGPGRALARVGYADCGAFINVEEARHGASRSRDVRSHSASPQQGRRVPARHPWP